MSLYLNVILKVLNVLTKILALNEFSYDSVKNQFVSSRYWHYYVMIVHCVVVWPFGFFVLFLVVIFSWHDDPNLNSTNISKWMAVLTNAVPLCGIAIEGYIILYYRRELCQLLNRYLKLAQMHKEMFGRSVYIPWYILTIHLVCEFYAFNVFAPRREIGGYITLVMSARSTVLFYLIVVSMLIHLDLIKSLDGYLSRSKGNKENRILRSIYLEYAKQLMLLHKELQLIIWFPNTYRLCANLLAYIVIFLSCYWVYKYLGIEFLVFKALLSCMWISNTLHLVVIAGRINKMERDILDRLYLKELFKLLHRHTYARTLHLEQLEQLHLKQCTLKERLLNIHNYIYVRRTLNLEIVDFFITNAFLLISLSLTYEKPKIFLATVWTLPPELDKQTS